MGAAYPLALVGVLVGVVAQCQASVCPLDLIQAGARPHAQQVVVARLLHHRPHRCEGEASPPCPASPPPPLLRASVSPLRVPPVDKPQCCAGGWGGHGGGYLCSSALPRDGAAPGGVCIWGGGVPVVGDSGQVAVAAAGGDSPRATLPAPRLSQRCPTPYGGVGRGGGTHTEGPRGDKETRDPLGRWGWATRGRGGR